MNKGHVSFGNIEIGLNYHSYDVDYDDVLVLDKINDRDEFISLTLDEARWLVEELPKFIERFENTPKAKLNTMISKLESGHAFTKDEGIKILKEIKELL